MLLSTSHKIEKSNKNVAEFFIKIMYLAPYNLSGYNVCPEASEGCAEVCLNTSGRGRYSFIQAARKMRTKFFFENRSEFLELLNKEIYLSKKQALKKGKKLALRLNGTSDLQWEKLCEVIQNNPDIQFYDYTKIFSRMKKFMAGEFPPNYYLTFSNSESNLEKTFWVLENGGNVSIVYSRAERFPRQFCGYKVVSGEDHDLRFLDPKNCVVGLWAKGKAKHDKSGFVLEL